MVESAWENCTECNGKTVVINQYTKKREYCNTCKGVGLVANQNYFNKPVSEPVSEPKPAKKKVVFE